mmetsp:Transcript_31079/g.75115  ORF Transcript_31079/g.75115 Transcript_31079/m.75115 type:complete len:740 (+) Transcript_31079:45-2264(+)
MDYYRPFDDADGLATFSDAGTTGIGVDNSTSSYYSRRQARGGRGGSNNNVGQHQRRHSMTTKMLRRESPSQVGTFFGDSNVYSSSYANDRQRSASSVRFPSHAQQAQSPTPLLSSQQPQMDGSNSQYQLNYRQRHHPQQVTTTRSGSSNGSNHSKRILSSSDHSQQQQRHRHGHRKPPWFRKSILQRVLDMDTSYDKEDLESPHHSVVYMTVHPRSKTREAKIYRRLTTWLIVIDLISFFWSTDPNYHHFPYITVFRSIEGVVSTFFLGEYLARLWVVTENKQSYGRLGPINGRLVWMCSLSSLIDICATIPFFVNWFTHWQYASLSYLRVFRLLRILKMEAYIRAFSSCYRVMHFNKEILYVALLVCVFLVVLCAVLLYYLRPRNLDDEEGGANPNSVIFGSIPATLFTALLMLTGQDSLVRSSHEMPWYTKLVVGMTGVMSVVMVALPVSLLTWGFEAEALRWARKTRRKHLRTIKRQQYPKQRKFDHRDSRTSDPSSPVLSSEDPADLEKDMSMNSDIDYLNIISKKSTHDDDDDDGDGDVDVDKMLDIQPQTSPDIRSASAKEMIDKYLRDDDSNQRYNALMEFLKSNPPRPQPPLLNSPSFEENQRHLDEQYTNHRVRHTRGYVFDDDPSSEDDDDDDTYFRTGSDTGHRIMELESSVHSLHNKLEYLTEMLLMERFTHSQQQSPEYGHQQENPQPQQQPQGQTSEGSSNATMMNSNDQSPNNRGGESSGMEIL